jgi:hypothetical protein
VQKVQMDVFGKKWGQVATLRGKKSKVTIFREQVLTSHQFMKES